MSNNSISVTCASVRDCSYYFLDQATKCTIIGDVTVLETCYYQRKYGTLHVSSSKYVQPVLIKLSAGNNYANSVVLPLGSVSTVQRQIPYVVPVRETVFDISQVRFCVCEYYI